VLQPDGATVQTDWVGCYDRKDYDRFETLRAREPETAGKFMLQMETQDRCKNIDAGSRIFGRKATTGAIANACGCRDAPPSKNHNWEHDEDQYPGSRQHASVGQSLADQSYQRKYTLVSLEQDRACLPMQTNMLVTGVVFALGMVIAGVSVTHGATAAEAAEEISKPQPLINRYEPPPSEAEPRISDREQLKRYFLQGERGWPGR
jgi:hypothetical protein